MERRFRTLVKEGFIGATLLVGSWGTPDLALAQRENEIKPVPFPSPTSIVDGSRVRPQFVEVPGLEPALRPHPPVPEVRSLSRGSPLSVGEISELKRSLPSIEEDLRRTLKQQAVINLFVGVHGLTEDQVRQSFEIYYPMYRVAERMSGVSWAHLAITHATETEFSLNTDPGGGGYVGAMQRDRDFYPDSQVEEYSAGLGFLFHPEQRYQHGLKSAASNDDQEIVWAGRHIRERALKIYPELPLEEAVRQVVLRNYSANGSYRIVLYNRLQEILDKANLP